MISAPHYHFDFSNVCVDLGLKLGFFYSDLSLYILCCGPVLFLVSILKITSYFIRAPRGHIKTGSTLLSTFSDIGFGYGHTKHK